MVTFLTVIHVLVSLFLILIVLVQGGKGAEMGATFGAGSSQTLFGSRGAATFMGKMTTVVAIIFMLTSMLLAIASVKGGSLIKSNIPAATRPTAPPAPSSSNLPEGKIPAASQVPLSNDKGTVTGTEKGTTADTAKGTAAETAKSTPAAPAQKAPAGK